MGKEGKELVGRTRVAETRNWLSSGVKARPGVLEQGLHYSLCRTWQARLPVSQEKLLHKALDEERKETASSTLLL